MLWSAVLECQDQVTAAASALAATSASSVAVGSGAKSFTIGTGAGFGVGAYVLVARTADPTGTWMLGVVTAYSGGDVTIDVGASDYAGGGTHSDWTLGISGPRGPAGEAGLSAGQVWGQILSM